MKKRIFSILLALSILMSLFSTVALAGKTELTISIKAKNEYTGKAINPIISVSYSNGIGSPQKLTADDYSVGYQDNGGNVVTEAINVGTYTVIISGIGMEYFGLEKSDTFEITPYDIANLTIKTISDQLYTGETVTPGVTIKKGTKTLIEDTDYIVNYSNNVEIGVATASVSGKGNYTGSKSATFNIVKSSGECGSKGNEGDVTWSLKDDGTLTITGNGAMMDYTDASNETPVRPTWEPLKASIKKVVIENGVTSVGTYAFDKYTNITNVTFGNGVKKINVHAFSGTGLKTVTIPANVEHVGSFSFANCASLSDLDIKNDLTKVAYAAFSDTAYYKNSSNWNDEMLYCKNRLLAIKNPDSVKTITLLKDTNNVYWEEEAFSINALSRVSGFEIDELNSYYKTVDGILYSKDGKELITCPAAHADGVDILDGVENVYSGAFNKCANITKLVFPESVKKIGSSCLVSNKNIEEVNILGNIDTIQEFTFYSCKTLKNIIIPKSVKKVEDSAFDGCTAIEHIYYTGTEDEFKAIDVNRENDAEEGTKGNFAFNTSKVFTIEGTCGEKDNEGNVKWHFDYETGTLTISGSGKMADFTFADAKTPVRPAWERLKGDIKKVNIKSGVLNVGECAFDKYTNLTNVTFGEYVKTIGENAFSGTGLESVTIPKNVALIDNYAFKDCSKLSNIIIDSSFTEVGYNAFKSTAYDNNENNWDDEMLYIGKHLIDLSEPTVKKTITLHEDTSTVYWSVFNNGTENIEAFEISNSNEYFKTVDGVLYTKNGRTLIIVPVEKEGEYTVLNGTQTILSNAFSSSKLTKIVIPSTIKKIGEHFAENALFTDVIINNGITEISESAFCGASNIENIVIPKSVAKVQVGAFDGCTSIKKIYYNGTTDDFDGITIESNNTPFTKTKVVYVDDCFGGRYFDFDNDALTINYTGQKGYTFVNWYDVSASDYLDGEMVVGNTYVAHWKKDESKVITDTIKIADSAQNENGEGWSYDSTTKTITIDGAVIDTYDKPIVELGSEDINLVIKSGTISCEATTIVANEGTGKVEVESGVYYFDPREYVIDGYKTSKNNDGTYSIKKKSVGSHGDSIQSVKITIANSDEDNIINANVGDKISTINKPTKEKKIFDSWYSDEALTMPISEDDTIKANTTLYAGFKWDPKFTINMVVGQKDAAAFGENVANDVAPIIRDDRTMLPARFIAENLGAEVLWDAENDIVTVTSTDKNVVIKLVIGSNKAMINDEEVILDSVAFVENDRTYTPVRFIAEALGAEVEWNDKTQEVIIIK